MAGLTVEVQDFDEYGLVEMIHRASREWPRARVDQFIAEWDLLNQAGRLLVSSFDGAALAIDLSPELVDLLARYGVGEVTG